MNARKLGDLLTKFDPDAVAAGGDGADHVIPFERARAQPVVHSQSTEEKVAEAYQRGRREGYEIAVSECEAKLKQLVSSGQQQLADERRLWASEQGEALAASLRSGYQELETNLARSLACLLEPVFGRTITRQAVDEFAAQLSVLIGDPASAPLRISGPADLLAMVRQKTGEGAIQVRCVPDDHCEVRVVCEQTVIETNLRAWTERLKASVQ
jgi:hypothetical protein